MAKSGLARVTAVIVHHRGHDMLERCLESLLKSTGLDLEVVIVANGCEEALPPLVETGRNVYSLESEESLGFSAANNLGLAWAHEHLPRADYYYFINNDTLSKEEALENLIAALREQPVAGIAGPKLLILGAEDYYNSLGIKVTEDAWGWDEGIGIEVEAYGAAPPTRSVLAVTGAALLIDSTLCDEIGGWTELYDYYFEDIDLSLKAWKMRREVIHVPDAVVFHQISATMSEGSERKHFFFWRNRLLLALVHWPGKLLLATFKRAMVDEILRTKRMDNGLQRRALWSAVRRVPAALRLRWRYRGSCEWCRFLEPPGSVPVITLPTEPQPRKIDWSSARAMNAGGRRVLVLGWSPLPFENERMNYAPGGRSWQLASPLAAAGHTVCLVCARIPGSSLDKPPAVVESTHDGVLIYRLDRDLFEQEGPLERLLEAFRPDVLIGAAPVPSRRAVELCGELPVWVDLFGDPMAEAQAKSSIHDRGDQLGAYCDLMLEVLTRGDCFSAVSARQRFAVIGQLGLAGRLSRATSGHELVHVIPCAEEVAVAQRGFGSSSHRPVVLWSGGFNTWCDVETLFQGLEIACADDGNLRVVITGQEIQAHDHTTFHRFRELVESSSVRDRFTILGAVSRERLAEVESTAAIALVTEKQLYERELGSSGRVVGWMARGVPLICAEVSELSEIVSAKGLGFTYPVGDAEALAERILEAVVGSSDRAEAARSYCKEELSLAATTKPLLSWVETARRAPDPGAVSLVVSRRRFDQRRKAEEFEARYHSLRSELGEIHQGRMWKLWMAYLAVRSFFLKPFLGRND